MASRTIVSAALLISLNLLFFTLVSSCDCSPKPSPKPTPKPSPSPPPTPKPSPSPPPPPPKQTPKPSPSPPPTPKPSPSPPPPPPPPPKQTPKPSPPPPPPPPPSSSSPSPSSKGKCPRDTLKLGVCANVLGGLVKVNLGPNHPCCTLVNGLVDLDAAVCLCTVIKADVLGIIKLKIPVDLSVLLNSCGKSLPKGFQCA